MRQQVRPNFPFRRRGVTAVLAMLYLVLFSTMAIGFYAATNTSVQVSHNDEKIAKSIQAAESGNDYMRFLLARVNISPTSASPSEELFNDLYNKLNGTSNLTGLSIERIDDVINIPAEADGWIKLDTAGQSKFRASITNWPQQGKCIVTITGKSGSSVARAMSMEYTRVPRNTSVFDNAIASKGEVLMAAGEINALDEDNSAIATIMSALPPPDPSNPASLAIPAITVSGGKIGGELTIMEGATVDVTGGNVAGTSNPATILVDHVNTTDDAPPFPIVDTNPYSSYASTLYDGSAKVQQNVRIPAGSGTAANPLHITGEKTLQGIVYIESPNVVDIQGSVTLQGFIVFEGTVDPTAPDRLEFTGNVTMEPLPTGSQFNAIRSASGVAVLAPTADVYMTGNSGGQNANQTNKANVMKGNIICDTFEFDGSADLIIDNGSIVTLKEGERSAYFHGKTVKFMSTGNNNLPAFGISFARAFKADPWTYEELKP